MLANLQRGLLATLALCAGIWCAAWWSAGRPWLAVAGVCLFAFGHSLVLAIEFVLLVCVRGSDPAPRAGPVALVSAWLEECWVSWRVFCWQQPFRARRWADVQGRPGVRGVLFVHGYLCNRGFWNPWLAHCHREAQPCVAINLEPVFSDLDAYRQQLEVAVARLERETGLAPVVVAHSMGGLVVRAWWASTPQAAQRVHRVVTIGAPHQGTWLARWSTTANARPMRPGSAWLRALSACDAGFSERCTCFYGNADNIVMPPSTATLPGADNRHLAATAHVALAYRTEVRREVDRWLAASAPAPLGLGPGA